MDPAWGTTLSDEDTARALCAFQHTQTSLTQRNQLPRSKNREMPPANGMSAFGYPASGAYLTIGRNEAASLLVEMHAPPTLSGDWQRQQQVAIQEQLEQEKGELETQAKQQQQRNMHVQLQQLQAQLQKQAQTQQIQVEQQVERIQQSRYLSGAGGFIQANVAASDTTPIFQGVGGSEKHGFGAQQMQQSDRFYDGAFGRSQQLLARQTAAPPSLKSDYKGRFQAGMPMSRSEAMFAPQPAPPSRNLDKVPTTAPRQWGNREPMPLSGGQTSTSSMFQRWATQRFLPQHPQPYHPVEITERSRQEASTLQNPSRQRPDETFLNEIMKHFPTSAGAPTSSASASYGSSAGYAAHHNVKSMFDSIAAQGRFQAPTQVHGHVETHSRPPVPPTGATVVPGVALAPQSSRLLTMRDILNGDDTSSRIDLPRNRQRGGKQKRVPPKRKIPRKKTTAKRQRTPQQQNEERSQPPPPRTSGDVQVKQGPSPVPGAGAGPAVKMPTPMYRAFMESRAARAQEQSDTHTRKVPVPTSVIPPPEPRRATPATQPVTITGSRTDGQVVSTTADKPKPVKRKKIDAPSRVCQVTSTGASLAPAQPSKLELSTISGLKCAHAVTSSVVPTPAVLRVENRTVVIFCKRDFMRYQAAKIWRKYQEQLKKHEEWREVRVAGKRTRYLNSRYDDEIQRTHKKTPTRSGKPRKRPPQVAKRARGHKALVPAAVSTPVDSTVSSSTLIADEGDRRSSTTGGIEPTVDGGPVVFGVPSRIIDAKVLAAEDGVSANAIPVAVEDEAPSPPIESEPRRADESNASSSGEVGDSINARENSGADVTSSERTFGSAVNAMEADDRNTEFTRAASLSDGVKTTDAGLESLISTAVDESLKKIITPSITESFSNCAIEVSISKANSTGDSAVTDVQPDKPADPSDK
ncbi:hypothetical protein V7S43_018731 [Phytophthora oleae]|uniref:Uncharacterized protein n=1 Tax=Phytophthora oleae TaxID=2107226 RepID=A0ABD3EPT5_9STRA